MADIAHSEFRSDGNVCRQLCIIPFVAIFIFISLEDLDVSRRVWPLTTRQTVEILLSSSGAIVTYMVDLEGFLFVIFLAA